MKAAGTRTHGRSNSTDSSCFLGRTPRIRTFHMAILRKVMFVNWLLRFPIAYGLSDSESYRVWAHSNNHNNRKKLCDVYTHVMFAKAVVPHDWRHICTFQSIHSKKIYIETLLLRLWLRKYLLVTKVWHSSLVCWSQVSKTTLLPPRLEQC